jgi:hypothetical protein
MSVQLYIGILVKSICINYFIIIFLGQKLFNLFIVILRVGFFAFFIVIKLEIVMYLYFVIYIFYFF